MKKRVKKKLTYKQAIILSFLITAIWFVIFSIVMILTNRNFSEWLFCGVMELAIVSTIFAISWTILENIAEQDPKEKERAISFLNKESFTEITYFPINHNVTNETFRAFEICGCRFFAKLIENDEILLLVKDNTDKVKYKDIIADYYYFNARFKQKLY